MTPAKAKALEPSERAELWRLVGLAGWMRVGGAREIADAMLRLVRGGDDLDRAALMGIVFGPTVLGGLKKPRSGGDDT